MQVEDVDTVRLQFLEARRQCAEKLCPRMGALISWVTLCRYGEIAFLVADLGGEVLLLARAVGSGRVDL